MKKILFNIISPIILLTASRAWAQSSITDPQKQLGDAGAASGLENANFVVVIGKIINAGLIALGIVLIITIIYGGIVWMTAGGNEEKIEKSKKILRNSIIGLLIISLSFVLTKFIFNLLIQAGL